jgi:hypothetical protein
MNKTCTSGHPCKYRFQDTIVIINCQKIAEFINLILIKSLKKINNE